MKRFNLIKAIQASFFIRPQDQADTTIGAIGTTAAGVAEFVPVVGPLLSAVIGGITESILSGRASDRQNAATEKANAMSQMNYEAETKESKRRFDIDSMMKQNEDLNTILTKAPVLKNNLINIWGGGK